MQVVLVVKFGDLVGLYLNYMSVFLNETQLHVILKYNRAVLSDES